MEHDRLAETMLADVRAQVLEGGAGHQGEQGGQGMGVHGSPPGTAIRPRAQPLGEGPGETAQGLDGDVALPGRRGSFLKGDGETAQGLDGDVAGRDVVQVLARQQGPELRRRDARHAVAGGRQDLIEVWRHPSLVLLGLDPREGLPETGFDLGIGREVDARDKLAGRVRRNRGARSRSRLRLPGLVVHQSARATAPRATLAVARRAAPPDMPKVLIFT